MRITNTYRLLVILHLLFAHITGFAQEFKIFGNVLDAEDSNCLSHVSISLISQDNYVIGQTQTDAKGQFRFESVESGDYTLKFRFSGYSDTFISIIGLTGNYEVKDVETNVISYQLDEVTVNAQTINQGVDRITFFPTQKIRESSQDALDVIRLLHMPGIKFDLVNHFSLHFIMVPSKYA